MSKFLAKHSISQILVFKGIVAKVTVTLANNSWEIKCFARTLLVTHSQFGISHWDAEISLKAKYSPTVNICD